MIKELVTDLRALSAKADAGELSMDDVATEAIHIAKELTRYVYYPSVDIVEAHDKALEELGRIEVSDELANKNAEEMWLLLGDITKPALLEAAGARISLITDLIDLFKLAFVLGIKTGRHQSNYYHSARS